MPRAPRKQSATDTYHVVTRGVNKRAIFEDDQDRVRFLELLSASLEKLQGRMYAWCLMSNHVHLMLCMPMEALSELMRDVGRRYSRYFNCRHGRVGHLFQQRFWSDPIESGARLMAVARYIHQNPVKAFMVPDCRYRWSSYLQYLGEHVPKLCDVEPVLAEFGGLEGFLRYHAEVAFDEKCLEIAQQMSDEEAHDYACRIFDAGEIDEIGKLDARQRDRILNTLKCCMLPTAQIARIAGVSVSTVRRA